MYVAVGCGILLKTMRVIMGTTLLAWQANVIDNPFYGYKKVY